MAAASVAAGAAVAAALVLVGWTCLGGSDEVDAPGSARAEALPAARLAVHAPPAPAWAPAPETALPLNASPGESRELDDLVRLSKLDAAWLAAHGFASGNALQRLHALLDARTNVPGQPRVQLEARPSGAAAGAGAGIPRLAAGERYVQATLAHTEAGADDSVLVRWRRTSDGTVMELSAQALPLAGEPLALWMHASQDWSPGTYRLEVISANPRMEPLAAADFQIVAPGEAVTTFSYPLQPVSRR